MVKQGLFPLILESHTFNKVNVLQVLRMKGTWKAGQTPSLNRGEYITQKWKLFSIPQGFLKSRCFLFLTLLILFYLIHSLEKVLEFSFPHLNDFLNTCLIEAKKPTFTVSRPIYMGEVVQIEWQRFMPFCMIFPLFDLNNLKSLDM